MHVETFLVCNKKNWSALTASSANKVDLRSRLGNENDVT